MLFSRRRARLTLLLALAVWLAVSACSAEQLLDPPRLATQTAVAAAQAATPTPLRSAAPTATPAPPTPEPTVPPPTVNNTITLWVNETSPAHMDALRVLTDRYLATNGTLVELRFVDPVRLPGLVRTARLTGQLPDLILHDVAFSAGWAQNGILDTAAAEAVVAELGADRFMPGVLATVRGSAESVPALPSHGWPYLLLYRQDWFDSAELPPPTTYDAMLTAAGAFFNLETDVVTGLVVPTDDELVGTQRAFEFLAIANGCQIIGDDGTVTALHPRCLEALDFYRSIVNLYSPPGFQTDLSAERAYLAGRTAMILSSPAILPRLAGYDPGALPGCTECAADPDYLAANTGFVTRLTGSPLYGQTAGFAELTLLGITTDADTAAARAFAAYWLTEGHATFLAVEPERKLPLYWGADGAALTAWRALPMTGGDRTLDDVFGSALVDRLLDSVAQSTRWGVGPRQSAVVGRLYEELPLSTILQEMLSGYLTSAQAIIEINSTLVDLAARR